MIERGNALMARNARNILTGVWTPGKTFYVGSGGSDTYSGLTPETPLLTINAAMDKCTANKGDVIQILGDSPSSPNDTLTITMDVPGVTLRGLLGRGMLSDSGFGSPTINVPTVTIAAGYVTIENLYLGCKSTGTTGGIIEFSGTNSYFGVTIRNVLFDTQNIPAYGIKVDYDQPYLLVEDCVFGRHDITGFTTANIYIGNLTAGMIRRNVFPCVTALGISAGANAGNFSILDNRFSCASNTVGMAITLADGSSGIYIDGNRANFGITDMANNPFRDLNNDDSNTWGLNHKGVTATLPVGT